jgi:hypothetical protein
MAVAAIIATMVADVAAINAIEMELIVAALNLGASTPKKTS